MLVASPTSVFVAVVIAVLISIPDEVGIAPTVVARFAPPAPAPTTVIVSPTLMPALEATINVPDPARMVPVVENAAPISGAMFTVTLFTEVDAVAPNVTSGPSAAIAVVSVAPPAPAPKISMVLPGAKPLVVLTVMKSEPAVVLPTALTW